MHAIYDRHLFRILGLQAVLVIALAFVWQPAAHAQKRGNYNFSNNFQNKDYYFGITLGYNMAKYRVIQSDDFILNDSIAKVESANGPGFNLGIVTNLKIGQHFDFRVLPTLSFAERKLVYGGVKDQDPVTKSVQSVYVEAPFHFRYKSQPYKDMRVFVVGGFKYAFDVSSNSRARQAENLVKVASSDFSVEFGAGIQFFLPYFILSPEIKFSYGLSDILIYDANLVNSSVLEKLLSRGITINIHFEG